MNTVSKTVKIKGKAPIPFTYEAPTTVAEMQEAFDRAQSKEQVAEKLTLLEVFNYGFELKIRAKIQSKNTDEQGKTAIRTRVTAWVMTPGSGGEAFTSDVLSLLKTGGGKPLNKYLDDLYEEEKDTIDAW